MNGLQQTWLVAMREMRERSRSRAFRTSLVLMIIVVVGVIVLPAAFKTSGGPLDVGFTGSTPGSLPSTIQAQGGALHTTIRLHVYDTREAGEQAVREGHVDVLVIDARHLEWRRTANEKLRALVTGSIQLVAVRERAAAAGISTDALRALVAPVEVTSTELGSMAGRSPDDETAALLMTVILFIAISTYGNLVLTGVVEEKSSRVVEVLLARMPARNLLAGKVAGIGLLGLGQVVVTALAALVAIASVHSIDVPAARGAVIAWAVVWFVLGYMLYAMVYGALGSLASRAEDAQAVAGPVTVVLIVAYFASFATIGSPESGWARAVSLFPATAPLAMPNRIAMGAAAWWEPLVALSLTLAALAGLVVFAGRVYARAVLHAGPALSIRTVWRERSRPHPTPATEMASAADRGVGTRVSP